jgi:hypothetical protein
MKRAADAAFNYWFPGAGQEMIDEEAVRLPMHQQLQDAVPIQQAGTIRIDLYKKYSERMNNTDLIPAIFVDYTRYTIVYPPNIDYTALYHPDFPMLSWRRADLEDTMGSREKTFACLFSILLGCDNAHDFTSSLVNSTFDEIKDKFNDDWLKTKETVDKNKAALFVHIKNANVSSVMRACDRFTEDNYFLLAHCICVINMEIYRQDSICYKKTGINPILDPPVQGIPAKQFCENSLSVFFHRDINAKRVAYAITRILGLVEVKAAALTKDAAAISTLDIYESIKGKLPRDSSIRMRIDALSASVNHASDVIRLIGRPNALLLVDDIASKMDPARASTLHGTLRRFLRAPDQPNINLDIEAYIDIGGRRYPITKAFLEPVDDKIKLTIPTFLLQWWVQPLTVLSGENSKSVIMEYIITEWMVKYKRIQTIPMTDPRKQQFEAYIKQQTCKKTLGDFLQIMAHAAETGPKAFHTFDKIAGIISSILTEVAIVDAGTSLKQIDFRSVIITRSLYLSKNLTVAAFTSCLYNLVLGFGKINNVSKRLKSMSHLELKNKLKSVGIKITKNVRGKRKYLSRKELENKARLFNKLQNTAKRMKIKIMYKSRNGLYKYKTYIRLQKEINSKYQKPVIRNFNFG